MVVLYVSGMCQAKLYWEDQQYLIIPNSNNLESTETVVNVSEQWRTFPSFNLAVSPDECRQVLFSECRYYIVGTFGSRTYQ